MTQTYTIEGMTCNGCRTDVEKRLNEVDGVINAVVDLEKKEAVIQMEHLVEMTHFQAVLPEKYSITSKEKLNVFGSNSHSNSSSVSSKSKLQQLTPLFMILGYISAATLLLNYPRENWNEAMYDFMGLFFVVFSFFKLLDLKGFPESFKMYDPLAKVVPIYAWIYPFLEAALGLMFLMRFEVPTALIITLVILSSTTIGVTKTLLDKKSIQCACLGTALKLPMTEATFIENAIMIVMALIMILM